VLIVLAFLCFLASGIWSAALRAWPMVLLAAGLALWVLDAYGPVSIG
jgi:hypothetical protein